MQRWLLKNISFILLQSPIFCLLLINLSCGNSRKNIVCTVSEDSFRVNPLLLNGKSLIKNIADENYLQSYDEKENSISFWKFGAAAPLFTIKPHLNFDDDRIGKLIQFDIYKRDSIFIVTENYIFLLDKNGEISFKKDISNSVLDDTGHQVVFLDNSNQYPLYFDSTKNDLYIRCSCNCYFMEPEFFQTRVEARFNLKDEKFSFLKYGFPEKYRHHFYGQLVFPFREINKQLNVISFQCDDSIYVYDRETNTIKSYKGKSTYQKEPFLTFDTSYKEDIERLKEHLIQTPVYQKILFDKYKNLYYRFFWNSQSLISSSGQYHGIFDRDLILMVFDKNFKLIAEKNIGNSYLWYYSFVSPKGLYIRKAIFDKKTRQNQEYDHFSVFSYN